MEDFVDVVAVTFCDAATDGLDPFPRDDFLLDILTNSWVQYQLLQSLRQVQ